MIWIWNNSAVFFRLVWCSWTSPIKSKIKQKLFDGLLIFLYLQMANFKGISILDLLSWNQSFCEKTIQLNFQNNMHPEWIYDLVVVVISLWVFEVIWILLKLGFVHFKIITSADICNHVSYQTFLIIST